MNNSQLAKEIQKAEEHLASLREQLESKKFPTIQDAAVGDTLEDGSVVLIKELSHAIVVCSRDREFSSTWHDLESSKTAAGFGPEWFIPSKELLCLAYQEIPRHFCKCFYWSSTENSPSLACLVPFNHGGHYSGNKDLINCVRAVRCIVFSEPWGNGQHLYLS